jgi:catecholate siderophore receptor
MRAPGDFADGETKTAAVYAFDTLKLNDRWQLNAGLRFERYDVEYIDTTPPATTPPTPAPLQLEETDNIVSWNAGVVYKPVEHGSIYLSAANTQSPPGGSNFTLSAVPSNANNPNVDPQESLIYELGTKWDVLGEQLSVTAAIFQAENTNVISTNSVTTEVDFNGEQQVDGFELGVAGQVTDRWGVFGGFSYLDSEFTETINPAQQRATLQWTPKKSANLWTTYALPMGFSLGGGLAYVDTVFRSSSVATPDAPAPQAPSFTVYYATAAWEANDHMSVRFNVDNVTDEEYVLRLNNNGGRYVPGPSRWYLLSADFSF